jgi:hypothetical protein
MTGGEFFKVTFVWNMKLVLLCAILAIALLAHARGRILSDQEESIADGAWKWDKSDDWNQRPIQQFSFLSDLEWVEQIGKNLDAGVNPRKRGRTHNLRGTRGRPSHRA